MHISIHVYLCTCTYKYIVCNTPSFEPQGLAEREASLEALLQQNSAGALLQQNDGDANAEDPTEDPKKGPKEDPKADFKKDPKEDPDEDPNEEPNEDPKKGPKEDPKEDPKEVPKEDPKEDPIELDESDAFEDPDAEAPRGWVVLPDPTSGALYFVHEATGRSQVKQRIYIYIHIYIYIDGYIYVYIY